jgi:hypothetical protein
MTNKLGTYEVLRHPSKCKLNELWELYKYIEGPANTFLTKPPSIFYTNKEFDGANGCPLYDMNLQSKAGSNNICVNPDFIERIEQPGPFMGTILYVFYDETYTNITLLHITSFIYFPGDDAYIYITDTTANEPGLESKMFEQLLAFLNKEITVLDIPKRVHAKYGFMPFLQEKESMGYCSAWAAGITETLIPKLAELQTITYEKQLEFFKEFYEQLSAHPTFGREFYNKLAMRSHGATRKGGRRTRRKRCRKSRRSPRFPSVQTSYSRRY